MTMNSLRYSLAKKLLIPGLFVASLLMNFSTATVAQETSVKPGINRSFENAKPQEFIEKFEIESREVFHQREEILKACRISPGSVVADIGAGTGLFTRAFSPLVGEQGRVIAVDISKNFLEHIQSTSEKLRQQNVETVLGKDVSANLPEGSIDLAFICDTYHHFEFPQKMMASIFNALKPGGRLIVVDFRRIEGQSSDWTLSHVRAGQDVVTAEILSTGFRYVGERSGSLRDNYLIEFQKPVGVPDLKSSIIPGIGGVAELTGAPEAPRTGVKVIFDVTASSAAGEVNAGLERAARLLNLYGAAGLKATDVNIAVIMHGDAALSILTNDKGSAAASLPNPNLELIQKLNQAGVEIMVCGQTLARKKIAHMQVGKGVMITTSAMTTLMNRQTDGYCLVAVPK